MSRKLLNIGFVLVALAFCVRPTLSQETKTYTDDAGRFQIPIPKSWTNKSNDARAFFTNADDTAEIYALVVDGSDLQTGIQAALEQVYPGFASSPVQTTDVPLPGGKTWTQNIYVLDDGNLLAAVARVEGNLTYVATLRGSQSALTKETQTFNQIILGHTLAGETLADDQLPDYVDRGTFTEQEISIGPKDAPLPATLTLPNGEGPFPVVVIVHGSGPSDRNGTVGLNKPYRDIAQGLASLGVAALRYDKRTLVYPGQVGKEFTVDDETTNDALAAVDALRQLDVIDEQKIFVIGHSQGGTFLPRIGERDPHIAGLIMLAGLARPFDVAVHAQLDYITTIDPKVQVGSLQKLADTLQKIREEGAKPLDVFNGDESQANYWASMLAYDPLEVVKTLHMPMLILQGERDYQVTMEDLALWQKALVGRDEITFKSYPTLTHLFIALGDLKRLSIPSDYNEAGFVDREVVTDIAAWILAH